MDWDWSSYPVLHLDLNIEKYKTKETLDQVLDNMFKEWENVYEITTVSENISVRFNNIIKGAYEKTGKNVVILVDEYDKPLVSNLHDRELFVYFRDRLSAVYSNFKSGADYIRLVFLTGVSRFGHLSVFSGLNNIRDISFNDKFSDICGISEAELYSYFQTGIQMLSRKFKVSIDDVAAILKRKYDGYVFSPYGKEMYNPYSLLNVMEDERFGNYWILSGQATLLLEQLKRFDTDLQTMFPSECGMDDLYGLDLDNPHQNALFYQTGYLTIKDYDENTGLVKLDIPNEEVKYGLFNYLLPYYSNLKEQGATFTVSKFVREFRMGDVEGFMNRLTGMFSSVSYDMEMNREQNLHNALLILMKLVGLEVETEYRTSHGRIDLFVKTDRYYYIMELKLDRPAVEALEQMNDRDYALPFSLDGREIIKIGISFSTKTRTISEWILD